MKYLLPFLGCLILVLSCKKEVEKPESEQLKGYYPQGNLLVLEVADTFINAIEYNFDTTFYTWDSLPVSSNYFHYVDSLNAIVGWITVEHFEAIGYFSPYTPNAAYGPTFFPRFYPNFSYATYIPKEELVINQTEIQVADSMFSNYYNPLSPDILVAWDKINNLRATILYRQRTPNCKIGNLKMTLDYGEQAGETRYYFFLANY